MTTYTSLVTSILELKLDQATMFEWLQHTHSSKTVPDYDDLLEFWTCMIERGRMRPRKEEENVKYSFQKGRPSHDPHMQPAYKITVWHAKLPSTVCMGAKYFVDIPTPGK